MALCDKPYCRSVSCSDERPAAAAIAVAAAAANGKPKPKRSSLMTKDRPRVKKTVSFSSAESERRVANAADCMRYMQNGCELKKLRSGRLISRFFFLTDDMREIRWMPSSKNYDRARVMLQSIKEVRHGLVDRSALGQDIEAQEECTFSIVHGAKYESLALVARTPDEASIWVAGLTHLVAQELSKETDGDQVGDRLLRDRWLAEVFQEADESNQGSLPEFEVVSIIRKLNPTVALSHLRQRIKELYISRADDRSAESKGHVTCEEFIDLYKDVASRKEVYFLMAKYSGNDDNLTAENFGLFLETEQSCVGVTREYCEELIEKYEPTLEGKKRRVLSFDGFQAYLLSADCDICHPREGTVHQDMAKPLSHYYISSSCKTYGDCGRAVPRSAPSIKAYLRALAQGYRYIEVDCWDGPSGEPIVSSSLPLPAGTVPLDFKDVVTAIGQHAFDTTKYPLIVAIESHCSTAQQSLVVSTLRDAFGKHLYYRSEALTASASSCLLPSPDSLQERILIAGDRPMELQRPASMNGHDRSQYELCQNTESILSFQDSDGSCTPMLKLCDLISLRLDDGCLWNSTGEATEYTDAWQLFSFDSEVVSDIGSVGNFASERAIPADIARKFLCRKQPQQASAVGGGVDAVGATCQPHDAWAAGCQIVAVNCSTSGICTDINGGLFLRNGGCGFVLKPAWLRDACPCKTGGGGTAVTASSSGGQASAGSRSALCTSSSCASAPSPQMLQLKIISGHQLPKPKGSAAKGSVTDPYVLVEILGAAADCTQARTRTAVGNGFNPFFDESFTFYLSFSELAMVRFVVLDDDFIGDEFIAQYCIPFECVQTGYRHLSLLNDAGEPIPNCTLFVHIAKMDAWEVKLFKRSASNSQKNKIPREVVQTKFTGIKVIDDLLKARGAALNEVQDLKYNVRCSLQRLRESCNASLVSDVKQCLRAVAVRAVGAGVKLEAAASQAAGTPPRLLTAEGAAMPELVRGSLLAYQAWASDCESLIGNADSLLLTLQESEERLNDACHGDLEKACSNAGLKGKKASKAVENLAWNTQVLREQIQQLAEAKSKCVDDVTRANDAAQYLNIIQRTAALP